MLWIKAFHLIFVISWFAGLFYLPRIFVNLALVPAGSTAERDRLLLMGGKLYRFTMWISVLAIALGVWLWLGFGFKGGWIHAKLTLVAIVVGYHHYCGLLLRQFAQGKNTRSHVWYRVFNELPVLALAAIVILAVVKPFLNRNPAPPSRSGTARRVTAAPSSSTANHVIGGSQYFAPCPRGLEQLLVEDVTVAGGSNVKATPGGVLFTGSLETRYRVNLESRIATRVLWQVAYGSYQREDDVYRLAREVNWSRLFAGSRTIRVYVTAIKSPLKSLEFITLRVKDAICDRFRDDTGQRPSVNTKNPDVRIHLFITATDATLYVDTSGEPLYMRGHKIARVEAPLKENLAAGILRLIGWTPGTPLLDPMCGSGTFLLEAAQMSLRDAPGLSREPGEFGFERLNDFDSAVWRRLTLDAAEKRLSADRLPIWGSDLDPNAVIRAKQNLAHAGIDDLIEVTQCDLLSRTAPAPSGVLIANPPYGERLSDEEHMAALYPRIGDTLKRNFAGWDCWLLSADTRLPKLIGLSPKRKTPIFNGALDCRVYYFPVVAGSNRPNN